MTQLKQTFSRYLAECPVIAILRGINPAEAVEVGQALFNAGIRIIEVPLNSPEPFDSIERLSCELGDMAMIGAGTVLTTEDVIQVRKAGGRLIVSPNTDLQVIAATVEAGMVSAPGFFTPTEAFAAINVGAHALKLFPAEAASPAVVKAQRAVLPPDVPLLVVGGVTSEMVGEWLAAGANGFGIGSGLYRPGQSAAQVHDAAAEFLGALAGQGAV